MAAICLGINVQYMKQSDSAQVVNMKCSWVTRRCQLEYALVYERLMDDDEQGQVRLSHPTAYCWPLGQWDSVTWTHLNYGLTPLLWEPAYIPHYMDEAYGNIAIITFIFHGYKLM